MRRTRWALGVALATACFTVQAPHAQSAAPAAAAFTLSSSDFSHGGKLAEAQVFNGFGCKGGNISPALAWSGAPEGTKSFALMVYDPDAPTGSGWWHWVVYNIPASATSLAAGAGANGSTLLPAGAVQGRTDFGSSGYGGPCPPQGDHPHRYLFTVFAVSADSLSVKADTSAAVIGFHLNFITLACPAELRSSSSPVEDEQPDSALPQRPQVGNGG